MLQLAKKIIAIPHREKSLKEILGLFHKDHAPWNCSAYYGMPQEWIKRGPFLNDRPQDEIARVVQEEFERQQGISSPNDVLLVDRNEKGTPSEKHWFREVYWFSARFSDSHVLRENYDPTIGHFLVRTQVYSRFTSERTLKIMEFGVNPKYQGKGLGRSIFEIMEEVAKRIGLKKIELYQPVSNKGFWKKMGFEVNRSEEVVRLPLLSEAVGYEVYSNHKREDWFKKVRFQQTPQQPPYS